MTIKQQGGIFGRNPTFNDLTAGSGSSIEGSGDNVTFSVDRTDASTDGALVLRAASGNLSIDSDGADKDILIRTGGSTERARFYGDSGNFSIKGNLIVDSGQGIDFSATSGTGTSELFDDYEEGTWTPTFQNVSAPTYTTQDGEYTKIGNIVHFYLKITYSSLDTGDGSNMAINLPYTPSTKMCIARVSDVSNGFNVSDQYTSPIFKTSGSNILATGITNSNAADYQDMNATGTIVISGSYSV